MEVNCVDITSAPTGQLIQTAYVVTDDGIIDDGNDVLLNADAPNDENVSLLSLMMMIMLLIPIAVTLVGIVSDVSDEQ